VSLVATSGYVFDYGRSTHSIDDLLEDGSVYIMCVERKYMSCKGTCLASIGPDQPAEVVDDAPEDLHACLLKHNQCFLVMVHISIPGDSALVHSAVSGLNNQKDDYGLMNTNI
ncbi:hypothetical protein Prudu_001678, partial [Prunus dulcis]